MAATSAQSTQSGAKAPKKKAASKMVDRTASPAPVASSTTEKDAADGQENVYIREVQKNIRNVNKKIFNASKTDAVLSEHAGKSLDELIASRILNADQKAQILKKPALQNQLLQLEEQLAQLKKVDADYQTRLATEMETLEKNLVEKLGKEKADAVQEITDKAEADVNKAEADVKRTLHDSFLIVSQFLRLAAARRAEEADPMLDENLALEGVLLAVYGGDENAVGTMLKLVEGTDDKTVNTSGEQLEATYSNIKSVAQAYLTPLEAVDETEAEIETGSEATATDEAAPVEQVNGVNPVHVNGTTPAAEAPAAEEAASPTNDASLSASQEWVDVSRPDEAEVAPEPAAPSVSQSWADDQPDTAAEVPAAAPADDGFHQVQRNRGREREGGNNWRGGRGRGEWRGRGGRGDGRGRRGGARGGAGTGHRGARKTEES